MMCFDGADPLPAHTGPRKGMTYLPSSWNMRWTSLVIYVGINFSFQRQESSPGLSFKVES